MKISETVEHAASPDEVFAMFCDVGYQQLKCERSGALDHDVAIEVDDHGSTVIVTTRQLPTTDFPDFARKFVGETVTVVETQEWGASTDGDEREAALTVEIPSTPVKLTGAARLTAHDGGGTAHVVDGELKANIPLLGSKIESAVAPFLIKAIRMEGPLGEKWRAAHAD